MVHPGLSGLAPRPSIGRLDGLRIAAAIALAFTLLVATGPAAAAVDADEHALTMSRRLMSPFCPGKTLQSCTSSQAAEWVDEIRQMVRDGMSDEEIVARLQARVPNFDLSGDPGGAWNWLLGVLAASLATGVLIIASRKLLGKKRAPAPASTSADAADTGASEDWEDRLDDELRDFDD